MYLPSLLYGLYSEATARCRSLAPRLSRGEAWDEAVGAPRLDTANREGLLVLDGPSPLLRSSSHFHCYLPLAHVAEAISKGRIIPSVEQAVFEASLHTGWGLLGLISPANVMWLYRRERHWLV